MTNELLFGGLLGLAVVFSVTALAFAWITYDELRRLKEKLAIVCKKEGEKLWSRDISNCLSEDDPELA